MRYGNSWGSFIYHLLQEEFATTGAARSVCGKHFESNQMDLQLPTYYRLCVSCQRWTEKNAKTVR